MGPSPTARLFGLTRDRFGVFTPAEAATVGVGRSQIRRMRGRGELEQLQPRVYGLTAVADSWERRALAALVAGGPQAVLSHAAAARIQRLERLGIPKSPSVELTYLFHTRPKQVPATSHESKLIEPGDTLDVGCFRVTSPLFTIGAMAVRRSPDRIAKALDAAIVARRFTIADVRDLIVRMWHTPGVVTMREAMDLVTPGAQLTRSEKERLFLRICDLFGIPRPEVNARVMDANDDRRYVDFLFREAGLAVEINAHPSHATTLGRRLDGTRQNALVPRFVVLNYDAEDLLREPDRVAAEVKRALEELRATR